MSQSAQTKSSSYKMDQDLTILIKGFVFGLLLILNIQPEFMGLLLMFVFVDSIFGVLKSIRIGRAVSYKILTWGIISKISVLFVPLLIAYMALTFKINLVWIVEAFIYIIAANELVSILGNIATIKTGKEYENSDFVAALINSIRVFFMKSIKGLIKKIDGENGN